MPATHKPIGHASSHAAEHTGQPRASGPPQGETNEDRYTNSGYPAGGQRSQRGRDPYGRKQVPQAPQKTRGQG